jgi:hypothetical protein
VRPEIENLDRMLARTCMTDEHAGSWCLVLVVVVVVSKCRSFAFSKRTETLAALQSTQFNTVRVVGAPVPGSPRLVSTHARGTH